MIAGVLLAALAAAGPMVQEAQPGDSRVLRGVVIDAEGRTVADVPIGLHRIVETGGTMVEAVTSSSDGRFTVRLGEDEPDGALYFVAARYQGELYIGPTFRPPFPEESEYIVQVGVEATAASRLARGVDPDEVFVRPPASPWRWGIAAAVLAALVGLTAVVVLRARGPDARRRLLIRIAELDEAHATIGAAATAEPPTAGAGGTGAAVATDSGLDAADDEDEYRARREELLERLRATS